MWRSPPRAHSPGHPDSRKGHRCGTSRSPHHTPGSRDVNTLPAARRVRLATGRGAARSSEPLGRDPCGPQARGTRLETPHLPGPDPGPSARSRGKKRANVYTQSWHERGLTCWEEGLFVLSVFLRVAKGSCLLFNQEMQSAWFCHSLTQRNTR